MVKVLGRRGWAHLALMGSVWTELAEQRVSSILATAERLICPAGISVTLEGRGC